MPTNAQLHCQTQHQMRRAGKLGRLTVRSLRCNAAPGVSTTQASARSLSGSAGHACVPTSCRSPFRCAYGAAGPTCGTQLRGLSATAVDDRQLAAVVDEATQHVLDDKDLDPSFELAADLTLADAVGESPSDLSAANGAAPVPGLSSMPQGLANPAVDLVPEVSEVAAEAAAVAAGDSMPADGVFSSHPVLQRYMQAHMVFSQKLAVHSYYETREHKVDSLSMKEMGTVKRAWLNFVRARPDVLFSVPAEAVTPLLVEPLPYEEDKLERSHRRLKTNFKVGTIPDAADLDGIADTQDLARVMIGAYYQSRTVRKREEKGSLRDFPAEGFLTAAADLMPLIGQLMDSEADPIAVAKAEEVAARKAEGVHTVPAVELKMGLRETGPPASFFKERGFSNPRFGGEEARYGGRVRPAARAYAASGASDRSGWQEDSEDDGWLNEGAEAGGGAPMGGAGRGGFGGGRGGGRGGRGDSGANMRPGDWSCPECNQHNFASRQECYKCSAPRPESAGMPSGMNRGMDVRPGDWVCASCSRTNFARRTDCFRCEAPKPENPEMPAGESSGFDRRPSGGGFRQRDNAGSSYFDRRDGGSSERGGREMKPGDWNCPACGQHNFSSRMECYKCSGPRVDADGAPIPAPARERRGGYGGGGGGYSDRGSRGSSFGNRGGGDRSSGDRYGGGGGGRGRGPGGFDRGQGGRPSTGGRKPSEVADDVAPEGWF